MKDNVSIVEKLRRMLNKDHHWEVKRPENTRSRKAIEFARQSRDANILKRDAEARASESLVPTDQSPTTPREQLLPGVYLEKVDKYVRDV